MELENSVEHIENLSLQNQTASEEREHLMSLNISQGETIHSLEAQIVDLKENTLRDADARYAQLMGQLEQERLMFSELKSSLSTAEQSKSTLGIECQKLTQLVSENNETIRSLQGVVQEVRTQLKSKDSSLEDMQRNLDDKMREIVSLVNSIDSLRDELSSVKEEKKTLVVLFFFFKHYWSCCVVFNFPPF